MSWIASKKKKKSDKKELERVKNCCGKRLREVVSCQIFLEKSFLEENLLHFASNSLMSKSPPLQKRIVKANSYQTTKITNRKEKIDINILRNCIGDRKMIFSSSLSHAEKSSSAKDKGEIFHQSFSLSPHPIAH